MEFFVTLVNIIAIAKSSIFDVAGFPKLLLLFPKYILETFARLL